MVKALDNSLVDLEVMPGSKQDEFREGNQQGNQSDSGPDAANDDPARSVSGGAQDVAGGVASTAGGALKGVVDTGWNTVGALGGGLADTAGKMYSGATAGLQDEGSTSKVDHSGSTSRAENAAAGTTQKTKDTLQTAADGATAQGEDAPPATEAAKDTGSKALEAAGEHDTAKRKGAAQVGQTASDAVGEAAGGNAGRNARSAVDTAEHLDEKRQEVTTEVGQQAFAAASNAGSKTSGMASAKSEDSSSDPS